MSAPSQLVLRAYGRTIGLSAPAACRELVPLRLPPAYRSGSGEPEQLWRVRRQSPGWRAYRDRALLGGSLDLATTTELMLSDLELWVAEHARARIFVHAGCVVVDGRAILLPGRSMTGKSSLVAALVRAGASYYSDEYAVLDSRGVVRPYARDLSLRTPQGGTPRRLPPAELGGTVGTGPRPVGLVAVLSYRAGARWSAKPVSRGHAILRLLENTVPARSRTHAALDALEHATADCLAVEGARGEAEATAKRLIRMIRTL